VYPACLLQELRGMRTEPHWTRLLEVHRQDIVERTIFGAIAISSDHGPLTAPESDPLIFGRSLTKPFQMKPIASTLGQILNWREKALALSSHNGFDEHVAIAKSMLPENRRNELRLPPSLPLAGTAKEKSIWLNPCSGKHSAILRACEALGWPSQGYIEASHPFHHAYIHELESRLGVDLSVRPVAPDGCLLPTVGLKLSELAQLFASLVVERDEDWIWEAFHRHPELIGGRGRLDSLVVENFPNLLVKEGADGLLGVAIADARFPNGLGIVIKLAHGYDMTVMWHLAYEVLKQFGFEIPRPPAFSGQEVAIDRNLVRIASSWTVPA